MSVVVRCAIYTRKSTEEGLDQAFNSLDAQREACEAYVFSQAGEGWRALASPYDDGGFSGGNLERPAMRRLLDDIDAGLVDVIVVYKVDRLTRSLMDFARIVERLDAKGVSFVSVTQAFNTTTSMGRLTLNVLLSFAQFEREVTGERIRDKIAASKAKGIWMGGNVPLGYDLGDRRLIVSPAEADRVRHIFARYLELGSLIPLQRELTEKGYSSKRWTSRNGREHGGLRFNCGALSYLLRNRIYLGEVVHKGAVHDGEHDAIIERAVFDAVQEALASRRTVRRERPTRDARCHLLGLVFGPNDQPLTTSFSYGRGGRLYRYYVSGSLDPSRSGDAKPTRFPAGPVERLVLTSMSKLLGKASPSWDELRSWIVRVELRKRSIQILIKHQALLEPGESIDALCAHLEASVAPDRLAVTGGGIRLIVDRAPKFRGGKAGGTVTDPLQPAGQLVGMLRNAHALLEEHSMSSLRPEDHEKATAPQWQTQRRRMVLGLLAPTLQKRILEGSTDTLPFDPEQAPLAWVDQLSLVTARATVSSS